MAQTKRKRQTKHRGNAAGVVETRGRTGRKPDPAEQKKQADQQAKQDRLYRPPTWKGAALRSVAATAIFIVAVILIFKEPVSRALPLTVFVFAFYVPLGYYTDLMLYRRRVRKAGLPDESRRAGGRLGKGRKG